MFLIYYIILPILVFWIFKFIYRIFWLSKAHKRWFPKNKLAQKLAIAARRGQLQKMDQIIKEGADINYQGTDGMTLLAWLLTTSKHNKKSKKAFAHLLKKDNIDLTLNLETRMLSRIKYNVIQLVGMVKDSEWLSMILKYYKPTKEELNIFGEASGVVEDMASVNNYKNFKILLDYGIDTDYKDKEGDNLLTSVNTGGDSWPFVYFLLATGVDPMNNNKKHGELIEPKPYLFWMTEDRKANPTNIISCCHGIDYRQKVVEYLEEYNGIKLNPWMPEDQKYVKEDGENILYIKTKSGKWKPYKKTLAYWYNRYIICENPFMNLFKKIWNTVYIGI